jgi:DNA modification methylase
VKVIKITNSRIIAGDCVVRMNMLEKESIDHIITDPPYEIGFMGKGWDNSGVAYNPKTWKAAHRVLKPNGVMLVFGATRTHHRIADAIKRAGFEIVDILAWTYGTGFPKSHNISKAIDKAKGAERKVVGYDSSKVRPNKENYAKRTDRQPSSGAIEGWKDNGATITAPTTPEAKQWDGWGTALKPAWEPIIVAKKKGGNFNKEYSPFHYIPKAGKKERNRGLDELADDMKNAHPTVKPVNLMKKLVLDFTVEGSTVLDAFMGSGSTGIACVLTNRRFVGIELTPEYIPLAKARIKYAEEKPDEWA